MREVDTLAQPDSCFVITIEIATDKYVYAIYINVSYKYVLISYGGMKVTFNTFYSNIFAKFRDLQSLTFLFLDLE